MTDTTPEPIKFELTDTTIIHGGVTLYRIRATEDIPRHGVCKGDLGGYVSSTHLPSEVYREERELIPRDPCRGHRLGRSLQGGTRTDSQRRR